MTMKDWLLETAHKKIHQEMTDREYKEENFIFRLCDIDAVFLHNGEDTFIYEPFNNKVRLVSQSDLQDEYGIYHYLNEWGRLWVDIHIPCTILIELVVEIGTGRRCTLN